METRGRKLVLVVEDDPDILELLRLVLEGEGYAVTTAENGREGLDAVARARPDLILLDMKMPVMDGWAFAREYHARHDGESPIVVVTAADDARKRAREVDAADWVAKPMELDELLAVVARHAGAPAAPA